VNYFASKINNIFITMEKLTSSVLIFSLRLVSQKNVIVRGKVG